jgi:hypothetical protein
MFIVIIGTRLSGKSTVQEYLVHCKGFKPLRLIGSGGSVRRFPLFHVTEPPNEQIYTVRMKVARCMLMIPRHRTRRLRTVWQTLISCKWTHHPL